MTLFLDSSVLVAALLSPTGGSFRVCRESNRGRCRLRVNQYVREEVGDVLRRKYPARLPSFPTFLEWANVLVGENADVHLVQQVQRLIHPEDAPVLAGALQSNATFLLTLDQKDFFTKKLRDARLPVTITTPKSFFQDHWPY